MDGVRTAEGGGDARDGERELQADDGRARIGVDGRLAGGLQALLGAPMAAYGSCVRERWRDRTRQQALARLGWREFAGTLGQWRTGAVRLGMEWLAVGPGRG